MAAYTPPAPYASAARLTWQVALLVFIVTILIGLMNGQRVGAIDTTAERSLLLTHLQTGTVGWITLALLGVTLWLFGNGDGDPRMLPRFAAVTVGVYPLTFYLFYPGGPVSNPAALHVFGTLALIAIVWMLIWTIQQSGRVPMSVARLGVLGALINLTLVKILDVLVELRFAGLAFPGDVNTAHSAMMTVGYVLPAAFALVEWRLGGGADGPRSLWGTISIGLLVVGGWLAVIVAVISQPALFQLVLLLQIAATIIFAVRMASRVGGASWLDRGGDRHAALAAIAIIVDAALLVYIVFAFFAVGSEPPRALLIGLNHTEFVGVLTNLMFATLLAVTASVREQTWAWADDVVFWGMSIGWIGFVVVELIGALSLVAVFTPILGVCLLIGIAAYSMRLRKVAASA